MILRMMRIKSPSRCWHTKLSWTGLLLSGSGRKPRNAGSWRDSWGLQSLGKCPSHRDALTRMGKGESIISVNCLLRKMTLAVCRGYIPPTSHWQDSFTSETWGWTLSGKQGLPFVLLFCRAGGGQGISEALLLRLRGTMEAPSSVFQTWVAEL